MSVSRSIVYFAYLGDAATDGETVRPRLAFMTRQLQWLSGLTEASRDAMKVLVSYTAPGCWDDEVRRIVAEYGFQIDPASVSADRRNLFEYPGFHAMKRLAEDSEPDALIYYCHSKGIAQLDERRMGLFRLHTQVGLTADLDSLTASRNLTRAGLFPFKFGWCWHNFFWIKAGYMAGLPVEESTDRYYFEELIGNRNDSQGYRGVLPLIDRLPFEQTGIAPKPWYRAEETISPALRATYDRYARMTSPPSIARAAALPKP